MRPTQGKFLSPERWNPKVKTFYEELVRTGDTFRQTLAGHLALPPGQRLTHLEMRAEFGVGIAALRGLVEARREYVKKKAYEKVASELNLPTEVDPSDIAVRGQYAAMVAAYTLNLKGFHDRAGVIKMMDDLASVDTDIAEKQETSEGHANVSQRVRDLLMRAGGYLPMVLFQEYEKEIIVAYGLGDIKRETLMEVFDGPIESLEDRLVQLYTPTIGKRVNPKEYGFKEGFTPDDYKKGEFIKHPHPTYSNRGLGEVIERDSYWMEVRFDDGTVRRFMVNPNPKIFLNRR